MRRASRAGASGAPRGLALRWRLLVASAWALVLPLASARAQGVTVGAISGTVSDARRQPASGATVVAVHEPSGSRYEAVSRADGHFAIPGMRVGGPYTVTASLTGLAPGTVAGVTVNLGVATDLSLVLGGVAASEEITVWARSSDVFSSGRTGAATTVTRDVLARLPTIRDRLDDFTRLTPQYTAGPAGFVGVDSRLNNVTVDGSAFNSFGLGGQPGDRTGVAPITTEALEEIQVNVAPYDVRQGDFVGAGINSVTRSGGNRFRGSAYYWWSDDRLVGDEAGGEPVDPGGFEFDKWGGWASGPLVRDKLAFFLGFEDEKRTRPATTFRANAGGEPVQGNVTRVLATELDALRGYMASRFRYETGAYQGYRHATPATRYLAKLNYNLSDRDKLSLRYVRLDSSADALVSNSPALGFGNRRGNATGLNFENSNFRSREDIRSVVGEWNSIVGRNGASSLIVGYTAQDESREPVGQLFPTVDILEGGSVYTTLGFEPFSPGNELRYSTLQLQESFTWSRGRHALSFGASAQRFASDNVFFQGSQGVYVYDSLADFYTDTGDFLANPGRTTAPVTLRRFQVRWLNVPGLDKPVQPLRVWYAGMFAHDEWRAAERFTLTLGLRLDVPFLEDTARPNAEADTLTFRDAQGDPVRYATGKLPEANVLWSPRFGFNLDVDGRRRTQLRGGTGVFTGRPPYVWISSQLAGTGVLTGFEQLDNTRLRPFNPDPNAYKPKDVAGKPASSYELALTDPGFRFPQVWRTSLAIDRRLPWGLVGTLEGLYTRDVNGARYVNVNLPGSQARLAGADDRPRWTSTRIHPQVTSAIVLENQGEGDSWSASVAVSRSSRAGFLRAAYSYGRSRGMVEAGSFPATSWIATPHSGDPNDPGVEYVTHGHRAFVAGSYRLEYGRHAATTVSFFLEGRNAGNASYTYAGDLNGDGGVGNDLLYVPRDEAEMSFQAFTAGGRTFTAAEQAAAWNAFIAQDAYLSRRRGRYAERNGVLLPMVWRLDLSVAQELFAARGDRRHTLQVRADAVNLTNLLDGDWGVAQRLVSAQPLTNATVDARGGATYRLRIVDGGLMARSLEPSSGLLDVYRIQLSVKYSFD